MGSANKNYHHLITWAPVSLKHTWDSCRYSEIYLNPLKGNYHENCTWIEVGWEYYRACSTPLRSGLGWAKHLLIMKMYKVIDHDRIAQILTQGSAPPFLCDFPIGQGVVRDIEGGQRGQIPQYEPAQVKTLGVFNQNWPVADVDVVHVKLHIAWGLPHS